MKKIIFAFLFLSLSVIGNSQSSSPHFPNGIPMCDSLQQLRDSLSHLMTSYSFDAYATNDARARYSMMLRWMNYQCENCLNGKEIEICTGYDPSIYPKTEFRLTREQANKWMYFYETGSKWIWVPIPSSFDGFMAKELKIALKQDD